MNWKEIVKKNIIGVISGVVALLAIVGALIWPFNGWFTELHGKVKASSDTYKTLTQLMNTQRFWPNIDPSIKVPLEGFPNQSTIAAGSAMTSSWSAQAAEFLKLAMERQNKAFVPLDKFALPLTPGQTAPAFTFLKLYRRYLGTGRVFQALAPPGSIPPDSIYTQILHAAIPPTDSEIATRKEELKRTIEEKRTIRRLTDNVVTNQAEVAAAVAEQLATVTVEFRQQRAQNALVYADANLFHPLPALQAVAGVAPNARDIFNAQIWLWIQEEFARSITEVNLKAGSHNILESPIKRVLLFNIDRVYAAPTPAAGATGGMMPTAETAATGTPLPMAEDAVTAASNPITPDYRQNPLGHTSNSLYDIFPVDMKLIVEADKVLQVLNDLCAKRFISIQTIQITSIDASTALAEGFLYGNKPVVELNLKCQYLLIRPVIAQYMPADMKTNASLVTTSGGSFGPAPGGGEPGMMPVGGGGGQ